MTLFLVVSGYCFLESTTAVKPYKIQKMFNFKWIYYVRIIHT